jgi:hypothetical protein
MAWQMGAKVMVGSHIFAFFRGVSTLPDEAENLHLLKGISSLMLSC